MINVEFASSFQKHVATTTHSVRAGTVREALDAVFADVPTLRGYVLDDQAAVRQHVTIFINGTTIKDRVHLSDVVNDNDAVFVFQALSGG